MQSQACLSSAERAGLRPKGNVPNLRFPEFKDAWKKERLKDNCTFFSGGTPSSTNKAYYDGSIPFIRSGEIASESTELFLSESGLNNSSAKIVEKGDLLLALYGATSGQIAISKIKGAINQAILCIRSSHNNVFLKSAWEKRVDKILQAYLQGGQGNLSAEIVKSLSFSFPTLQEQKKIGHLISLIDERIETQSRTIEELKLLRNTLMFKLFTPKDKWLKLSIGDVAHVIGGGTPDTNIEDYWNGNIQWFTPSEIGKEKYVTGSERTLTQKGLDNSSAKLLPPNTILLSTRATIGECSIAKQECCTNQGFQSLIATTVTPEFLYYLIQTKRRDLLSKASGSTFSEISANEVRKIHICIPTTAKEQEAIVQPLSAYDEKIETEYKMLHLFKMQKQYLLSHMFI